MDSLFFPSTKIPLLALFIVSIHLSASVFAVNEKHRKCSTSVMCGNSTMEYPFWGGEARPEYCGHPSFELKCTEQVAEIKIMSASYKVIDIQYKNQTVLLQRRDTEDVFCHTHTEDGKLGDGLIPPRETQFITLYVSCHYGTEDSILTLRCPMEESDVSPSYYVQSKIAKEVLKSCSSNYSVLASKSAMRELTYDLSEETFKKALKENFNLTWDANKSECIDCARSGGSCGYDPSKKRFACHCDDRTYEKSCKKGKKKSTAMVAGVAVAGAAGLVLVAAAALVFVYRRRKRNAIRVTRKGMASSSSDPSTNETSMTLLRSISSLPSAASQFHKSSSYFGTKVFSYAELEVATRNFSTELGDGGFGTVYHGVLRDGRQVAVKRLYENNLRRAHQFANEVKILAGLAHPNLVMLYGCTSRHGRELLLVYEYVPNGTVADHLHGEGSSGAVKLSWSTRLNIAAETANALAYLHGSDVIHRDVKTNNILLDSNFSVKVADFGLSRLFPTHLTHVSTAPQGTPGYVDPDYYQCYQLTEKSDVYSLGVVLVELISAKEAVDITRQRQDINLANMAMNRIQNCRLQELVDPAVGFDEDESVRRTVKAVAELAFRCLQQDRDMRPTMTEIAEILREIRDGQLVGSDKAEVLDISADDPGLRNAPPPLSPQSTDKNTSGSTITSSF